MERITMTDDWCYHDQHAWCFESFTSQSPINITTNETEPMIDEGGIELHYDTITQAIIDNGHAIQGFANGVATINNRRFELVQYHFHAHSEHTINKKTYPVELHFVHKAQNGRLAVIAVFMELGNTPNKAIQQIIQRVDRPRPSIIDLTELYPKNKHYYHYLGSLTTPPLNENVEWYILEEPITITDSQLKELTQYHAHNAREQQPLNQRPVLSKHFSA